MALRFAVHRSGVRLAASSLALGHQADGQLLAVIKTP